MLTIHDTLPISYDVI